MKTIKFIFLIISTLSLASCEYDIEFNDKLPKDKLVVTSFIEADSVIYVKVSKSARPGTYNNYYDMFKSSSNIETSYVKNALVSLYINGELKETKNSALINNKYSFNYIPNINDKVEINVDYNGFDQVSGNAILNLYKPIIDSTSIDIVIDSSQEYLSKDLVLYIEIIDNGLNDNYYQLDGLFIKTTTEGQAQYEEKIDCSNFELIWENIVGVYNEEALSSTDSDYENKYKVFSNKRFKGKTYKAKFIIDREMLYKKNLKATSFVVSGNIFASTIEKQVYQYLYTLGKAYSGNDIGMGSEPVIIIDGLKNGYGFIGGRKTTKSNTINYSSTKRK